MHDDPEAEAQAAAIVVKVMGAVAGVTLVFGLALGAVLWAITQVVRHLFGR